MGYNHASDEGVFQFRSVRVHLSEGLEHSFRHSFHSGFLECFGEGVEFGIEGLEIPPFLCEEELAFRLDEGGEIIRESMEAVGDVFEVLPRSCNHLDTGWVGNELVAFLEMFVEESFEGSSGSVGEVEGWEKGIEFGLLSLFVGKGDIHSALFLAGGN